MLPRPPPVRTREERRNKKLWCEYHKECGHTTRDCRELKKALDKLADQGKLNKYLKKPTQQAKRSKPEHNNEIDGYIGVIAGGFATGGTSNRARKIHLQNLKRPILQVEQQSATSPIKTFGRGDNRPIQTPHDNPLVIEMKVANSRVKRVLVNSGSLVDIITMECLSQLKYKADDLKPIKQPLVGFGGQSVHPLGVIKLPVRLGANGKGRSKVIRFLVIDTPLPHNIIIGRPLLNKLKAAISTYLLLFQIELDNRTVRKIYGDQQTGRECYLNNFKNHSEPPAKKARTEAPTDSLNIYLIDNPKQYERPRPSGKDKEESIDINQPTRTISVGTDIQLEAREAILQVLRKYRDIFAYTIDEMPGMSPSVMEHHLHIKEGYKPIK